MAERTLVTCLKRVGGTVGISTTVAVSLLTFPSAIPWMVGLWLSWHTWLVARGRPGWLPLLVCALVLLVKGSPWPSGVIALGAVMLAAAVLGVVRSWKKAATRSKRLTWMAAFALWIAWAVMAIQWHTAARSGRQVTMDPSRPVVCLGDSLTAGVPPGGGYPQYLDRLIAVPVVNLGQDGITSTDALGKLPALIAANPQAVVVEIGGHDFLKGYSRDKTRANLERIIDACHAIGAEVVLMEIPRAFIADPYAGLERELARRHDLQMISDTPIRKLVLWGPYAPPGMWLGRRWHLSDDGLHPNARGNRVLAEEVAAALARRFGPRIMVDQRNSRRGAKAQRKREE